jgi:hypothetical protein
LQQVLDRDEPYFCTACSKKKKTSPSSPKEVDGDSEHCSSASSSASPQQAKKLVEPVQVMLSSQVVLPSTA